MNFVGSFEIDHLHYGVMQLNENYFLISVPTLGTQRNANHVAPKVFATINGDSIILSDDITFNNEEEQAIKAGIRGLLRKEHK